MSLDLQGAVAELMERAERRYYGKYRGTVVDNEDPAHLGRLKLSVPSVFGPDVVTGWATPCLPFGGAAAQGLMFVPEREARVWVEFEEGDLEFPIWVGTFWCSPDSGPEVPAEPKDGDRPTTKIIKTLQGHTIELEDDEDAARVVVRDGAHGHQITLDKSGITLADAKGNTIAMGEDALTVTAKVPLTFNAQGQPVEIVCAELAITKG